MKRATFRDGLPKRASFLVLLVLEKAQPATARRYKWKHATFQAQTRKPLALAVTKSASLRNTNESRRFSRRKQLQRLNAPI